MNQRELKTAEEYSLTGSPVMNHLECAEPHENASRGAKDNRCQTKAVCENNSRLLFPLSTTANEPVGNRQ
jgi:hypothetical protein